MSIIVSINENTKKTFSIAKKKSLTNHLKDKRERGQLVKREEQSTKIPKKTFSIAKKSLTFHLNEKRERGQAIGGEGGTIKTKTKINNNNK